MLNWMLNRHYECNGAQYNCYNYRIILNLCLMCSYKDVYIIYLFEIRSLLHCMTISWHICFSRLDAAVDTVDHYVWNCCLEHLFRIWRLMRNWFQSYFLFDPLCLSFAITSVTCRVPAGDIHWPLFCSNAPSEQVLYWAIVVLRPIEYCWYFLISLLIIPFCRFILVSGIGGLFPRTYLDGSGRIYTVLR